MLNWLKKSKYLSKFTLKNSPNWMILKKIVRYYYVDIKCEIQYEKLKIFNICQPLPPHLHSHGYFEKIDNKRSVLNNNFKRKC